MFHCVIISRKNKFIGISDNIQEAHDDAVRCLADYYNISFDRALRWIKTPDNDMVGTNGAVTMRYVK